MRKTAGKILAVVLSLLMVSALLPAAAAEPAQNGAEPERIARHETEKAAPQEGERTVDNTALKVGENQFTVAEGETVYRPFKPSKDAIYRIYSTGNSDTYGYLTDGDLDEITSNDDANGSTNFCIQRKLDAGETYYIGVRYYFSDYSGTISVTIEQYDAESCGDSLKWSYNSGTGKLTITGSGDMWDFAYEGTPWEEYRYDITAIALPSGLTSIGDYAFAYCYELTSVSIPDSVTRIGYSAFCSCSELATVTFPKNLQSIESEAFVSCEALKTAELPDGLSWIGSYAFAYSGLTSASIPASVTDIYNCAFACCANLLPEHFTVDPANAYYKAQNGALLTKDGYTLCAYLSGSPQTSYTVPNGVVYIDHDAFLCSSNLISVTLPEGVTDVDSWAFENCYNLETVTLPVSLTAIGFGAFYSDYALTDVYYGGTQAMRTANLEIDEDYGYNAPLLEATWHYADETDFDGTIEWNKDDLSFRGTTPYVVADGSAHTPRFTVKDAKGNTVPASTYTYEYRENVNAGTGYVLVTFKSGYTGTARQWFKIYLPPTSYTWVENTAEGIRVTWAAVEGAAGYVIYRRAWNTTSSGWTAFARWDNVTDTSYLDGHDDSHKVYANTRYQYGVKAYFERRVDPVSGALIGGNVGDNYNLGEVGPLKTTVRITTRDLTKVVSGSKQITVYWSPSRYFTGYQIQCATDEGFTKNVQTVKITDYSTYSTVFGSLTNGTRYYFRVRSYREFEGMTYFGGWSNVLSVKAGSGETVTPAVTTYRALCIGQNYTGSSNALAGCINDMKAIAGMLGGLGNSFTATTLEDASKTQILNGITSAYAGAKDTDVSIFTYSGHGVNAGGSGTNQGALCTFESNGSIKYITLSELASALSNVPGRVIVILDSCHSGSAVKGSGSEMDLDAFNQAVIEAFSGYYLETGNAQEGEKLGELKQSKFVVITAASYDESSWDGHFDGSGYSQGAFSAALVKALGSTYPNGAYSGGSMPADKDKDNKITLKELYDYVYTTAYNWAGQHAQYYGDDAEVLFFR